MKNIKLEKLVLLFLVTLFILSSLFSVTINAVSSDVSEDYVPSTDTKEESSEVFLKEANDNIQFGFDIFSHEDNGTIYTLESENVWNYDQNFSWDSIKSEIDAGHPIMLGFGGPNSPYGGGHMTVCVEYNIENDDYIIYVSDAWESEYVDHELSLNDYNDFFATVILVQEDQ